MKRIAVINLGPIGDVINSSPVCIELKKSFPLSKLLFITIPESLEATRCIPGVDEVIIYDKRGKHKGLINLIKFTVFVRLENKIDMAIILNETFRSAGLSFLIGAKQRIGRASQFRDFLLTKTIPFTEAERDLDIPASEHYIRVLKPVNLYNSEHKTEFNYCNDDKEYIERILRQRGYSGYNLIGLCPCSKTNYRDWEPEEAAQFINYVNQDKNSRVVIIGTEKASAFAEKLRELGVRDFLDISCQTRLSQLAALIDKFKIFVSVDTGPMHLGFALNIPTISLFVQENYKKWGPRSFDINRLIYGPGKIKAENVIAEFKDLKEKLKSKI